MYTDRHTHTDRQTDRYEHSIVAVEHEHSIVAVDKPQL